MKKRWTLLVLVGAGLALLAASCGGGGGGDGGDAGSLWDVMTWDEGLWK